MHTSCYHKKTEHISVSEAERDIINKCNIFYDYLFNLSEAVNKFLIYNQTSSFNVTAKVAPRPNVILREET